MFLIPNMLWTQKLDRKTTRLFVDEFDIVPDSFRLE